MCQVFCVMVLVILSLAVATPGQDKETRQSNGLAKIAKDEVVGAIAFPSNRTLTRITGKVKVIDAHTLIYEDGTEVDFRGGTDAPDLEQKGLIDNSLYPCGKEAAEFLKKLIGDNLVTCYAFSFNVNGNKITNASVFVGEMNLNIEMVRNGWAISDHSGMDAWEIIARDGKRGLWRGKFVVPERWRNGERLPEEK